MKLVGILGLLVVVLLICACPALAARLTSPLGTANTSTVKAASQSPLLLTSSYFFGTVECKSSAVEGNVEAHGTVSTVSGQISRLEVTGCNWGEPTSPVSTRGSLELHSTGSGTGTVTSNGAAVFFHKTPVGTCIFTTKATDVGTFTDSSITKGNAIIDIAGVTILQTSGNPLCPPSVALDGSYKVTTPSVLYID